MYDCLCGFAVKKCRNWFWNLVRLIARGHDVSWEVTLGHWTTKIMSVVVEEKGTQRNPIEH